MGATIRSIVTQTTTRAAAYLTPAEVDAVDALVARIEARTGVQIATAITGKSDVYAELPWKAFALGASLAAFVVVVADARAPQWTTAYSALLHAAAILLSAGAAALLAIFVPPFARLFLREAHSDVEVRHYAESLFLRHALFGTRRRTAVLIFISLFERRIEILADTGVAGRVTEVDWHGIIARMTPRLRERRPFHALEDALTAAESLLVSRGFAATPGDTNELPDRPIQERGPREVTE